MILKPLDAPGEHTHNQQQKRARMLNSRFTVTQMIAAVGVVIAGLLFFLPPGDLDLQTARVAALTLFLIVFWATNTLPPFLPVLIFFAVAMIFDVIPPSLAFSGFTSGAIWMVFGGLVIGAAVKQTGLATRIADMIISRFGGSYRGLVAGVIMLGVLISFFIPSSVGRVVMLVPIAVALADHYQFAPDARGRYGIILAMVYGTHTPSFGILPANVPNLLFAGTVESVWGEIIAYGTYFFLHFPVLGLLKAGLIFVLITVMFRDQLPQATDAKATRKQPMSADAKRLSVIMIVVLLLWGTDFVHGIAPSWVALGAAVILLLPRVGILSAASFNQHVSYATLIFIAGVIGLGAVIAGSGLVDLMTSAVEQWLPLSQDQPILNFIVLSLTATLTSVVGTVPTVPALLVPLADSLSRLSGLPLMTVLMTQVVGFSTIFFPYQAPPLLVGAQLGNVKMGLAIRFTIVLGLATLVVLLPLDLLWWILLGYL